MCEKAIRGKFSYAYEKSRDERGAGLGQDKFIPALHIPLTNLLFLRCCPRPLGYRGDDIKVEKMAYSVR